MLVSNTFTVNVIFCPSKANTWQITKVSNSTKRHADKAEIMQTPDLLKFAVARSNGSTLLKIPPHNTT